MPKKVTKHEFLQRLSNTNFKLVGKFVGLKEQATFECTICNTQRTTRADAVLSPKTKCECQYLDIRTTDSKRGVKGFISSDYSEIDFLEDLSSTNFTLVDKYIGWKQRYNFKCNLCGEVKNTTAEYALRGARCRCQYSRVMKHSDTTFKQLLVDENSPWKFVSSEGNKFRLKHPECGHEFVTEARGFKPHRSCPTCRGYFGRATTIAEFQDIIDNYYGVGEYTVTDFRTYTEAGNREFYVKHHSCGTENWYSLYMGHRRQVLCTDCCPHQANLKEYTVGSVTKYVQGIEDVALDYILETKPIELSDILVHEHDIKVKYTLKGIEHHFHPDFHIPSKNIIIEVKDIGSFGYGYWFENGSTTFLRNKQKVKATLNLGYKCIFLVMDRKTGKRIKLPSNWYDMSYNQLGMELGLL